MSRRGETSAARDATEPVSTLAPDPESAAARLTRPNCPPPPPVPHGDASPFHTDVPSMWFVLPMNNPNGVDTSDRAPKFQRPSPKAFRVTSHQYWPSHVPQMSNPNSGASSAGIGASRGSCHDELESL